MRKKKKKNRDKPRKYQSPSKHCLHSPLHKYTYRNITHPNYTTPIMFGGSGGGSMLRVVGRAVARAGVTNFQEPISTNTSSSCTTTTSSPTSPRATRKLNSLNNDNNTLSLSSSGSVLSVPISANSGGPISTWWPSFTGSYPDDYEWVSVDGSEDERLVGFNDDFVLGPVPSMDEVHDAVTALTQ